MAYNLQNWSRQSVALNTGQVLVNGVLQGGPALFSYRSAIDALAVITAANYFAPARFDLAVNDLIMVVGSDGSQVVRVTAVDRTAATITVVALAL